MAPLVMPSCTRKSMMVVFKTGRSPHIGRPRLTERDTSTTAVERWCRYLIYSITIISYNRKRPRFGFSALLPKPRQRASIDDCFQERGGQRGEKRPPGPQGATRERGGKHRAAIGRIVRAVGLFAQACAIKDLRKFPALRCAAPTDPGAVLGAVAARQESWP